MVGGVKTVAYGPKLVVQLAQASSADAVLNADSYTWFSIAMYLPAYDWNRGIVGVTPVVPGSANINAVFYLGGQEPLR